jgi:glutamyl-tRNA reductase
VGLSHKTAPVEVRERIALDEAEAVRLASSLLASDRIAEVLCLSTCNRTEVYAYAVGADDVRALALRELAGLADAATLEGCAYTYEGREAIAHLFRVASGLDSMVVGEAQILAQLKSAYQLAARSASIGMALDRLCRHALETGKRVRTQTNVGCGAVSVSSAAVELALQVFGTLQNCVALILGAGETSELTATHLRAHGVKKILICNRTYETSNHLARRVGGRAVHWGGLEQHLRAADIVISSTAAPHYVVTRGEVESIMRTRKDRPLFVIDIAVPRDCEPEIGAIDGVHLYDIDDLTCAVESNRGERAREATLAEGIVVEEVGKAEAWLAGLEVVPTIVALRGEIERLRNAELARSLRRLSDADERTRQEIEAFSRRLTNKILHVPTTRLQDLAARDDTYVYVRAVRRLFALDEQDHAPTDGGAGPTTPPTDG